MPQVNKTQQTADMDKTPIHASHVYQQSYSAGNPILPTYKLTLGKTYIANGFFNLGVEVERFVRSDNEEISIFLGKKQQLVTGTLNRDANANGTPRIFGGSVLKEWFAQYHVGDAVEVHIMDKDKLWLI